MEPTRDIVLEYFKNPKFGLSTKNVLKKMKEDGYKINIQQVRDFLTETDEYQISKEYKRQTKYFLKTVANPYSYQADLFFIKHNKKLVNFLAVIHIESRLGYVYHLPSKTSICILSAMEKLLRDVKFPIKKFFN